LPDMEPRYYVLDQILRPLDVGEVPPATPSSVLEDGEEEEEEDSSMVIPALVKAKHEPVWGDGWIYTVKELMICMLFVFKTSMTSDTKRTDWII